MTDGILDHPCTLQNHGIAPHSVPLAAQYLSQCLQVQAHVLPGIYLVILITRHDTEAPAGHPHDGGHKSGGKAQSQDS